MNTNPLLNNVIRDTATASAQEVTQVLPWVANVQSLGDLLFIFIIRFLIGSIVLLVGLKLIRHSDKLTTKIGKLDNLDPSISSFIFSLIRVFLYIILLFATFSIWGFATTSFIAVLGGLSLAVGLALQGSMSNVASGVLILLNKPIQVGDFITVQTFEGTVKKIELFHTTINTFDNRTILIPNSLLMTQPIQNFSREMQRRIDLKLQLSYKQNIDKALQLAESIVKVHENVLHEPDPPQVVILSTEGDIITIAVRGWVQKSNFIVTKREILSDILEAFQKNKIELAHPARVAPAK